MSGNIRGACRDGRISDMFSLSGGGGVCEAHHGWLAHCQVVLPPCQHKKIVLKIGHQKIDCKIMKNSKKIWKNLQSNLNFS